MSHNVLSGHVILLTLWVLFVHYGSQFCGFMVSCLYECVSLCLYAFLILFLCPSISHCFVWFWVCLVFSGPTLVAKWIRLKGRMLSDGALERCGFPGFCFLQHISKCSPRTEAILPSDWLPMPEWLNCRCWTMEDSVDIETQLPFLPFLSLGNKDKHSTKTWISFFLLYFSFIKDGFFSYTIFWLWFPLLRAPPHFCFHSNVHPFYVSLGNRQLRNTNITI